MKLTDLQQLIDDVASDAMSDALDMDVGISELSDAASIELSAHLHEIIRDELERVAKLFGPRASVTALIRSDRGAGAYAVSLVINPQGESNQGIGSVWGSSLPEAIANAEKRASEYIASYRAMTAEDLGLGIAA